MSLESANMLIGRDPQRAKLLSAIYSTVAGRSAVCFLEGTIGSGKSTLALEARRRASAAGLTVISVSDLLLDDGICGALMSHGPGPYCLVVDDFHRAESATHDALDQLIETGTLSLNSGPPVLLLVTTCPIADRLGRQLARMADQTGTRITLDGISRHEMRQVLRQHSYEPAFELLNIIHTRSAGNPGIALRLAEADLGTEAVAVSTIPQDYLRPEVEQLAPCLRTFLEVLALDGGDARADQTAEVSVEALADEDEFLVPLPTDELVDALRPVLTGNGHEVKLADQAWRDAAVALMTPSRRQLLHELLAQRTSGLARARHLSGASPHGNSELAIELEAKGAEALAEGDYSASAEYLGLAMRVSTGDERRRLLISAALTMGVAESPPGVQELYEEIGLLDDPTLVGFFQAGLAFFTGDLPRARSLLHTQLRTVRTQGPDTDVHRWRMLILLCSVEIAAADEKAAQAAADEARSLNFVPSTPVDIVMSRLLVMHEVYSLWNTGRVAETIDRLDVFLIEAEHTPEHTDALYFRGRVHFYAGHVAAALADLERAEESRHQKVVPAAAQRGMAEQAFVEWQLGRWTDAILRAERVIVMARKTQDWRGLASSHAVLAMAGVAHADETAAAKHVDWLTHHVTTSSALPLYNVTIALAWTARMSGDHERVLEVIAKFRRSRLYSWSDSVGLISWRAFEIAALLDSNGPKNDRLREAERLLDVFTQKVAQRPGLPLPFGHPLALRARLAAKRGDFDSALEGYRASIWLAAEFPHTRARLHHALGEVHRELGEHMEADSQLEAARNIFAQLGAAPELSDVKSRLLSVAGRYATLTPRERDIAYLISQGRTNREIAESQFVSVKTVEYHVSNLLPKLGMSSRRELWTAAAVASTRTHPPDQVPGYSPGMRM